MSANGVEFTYLECGSGPLALCLHELFSNAARYGALSQQGGRVGIDWTSAGSPGAPRIQLRWRESGVERTRYPAEVGDLGTALIQVLGRDPEKEDDMRFIRSGGATTAGPQAAVAKATMRSAAGAASSAACAASSWRSSPVISVYWMRLALS